MSKLNCVLISAPGNLGYKFVAEGIVALLNKSIDPGRLDVTVVDKHARNGIVEHFERARRLIEEANIIILAGGPILWPFVNRCDWGSWLGPAILRAAEKGTTVAGVALGSCYGLEPDGVIQSCRDEDLEFILPLLRCCSILTVRDRWTKAILDRHGVSCQLLPCLGFIGTLGHRVTRASNNSASVLINHVRGAGPHDYLEIAHRYPWLDTTRKAIIQLKTRWDVQFLCHSVEEYEIAPNVDSSLPAFLATTTREFASIAGNTTFAINNRIHASIGLAGLGIPSLTVGNDSRIFSLEPFGLPVLGLPWAEYDSVSGVIRELEDATSRIRFALDKCLADATEAYSALFHQILNHCDIMRADRIEETL